MSPSLADAISTRSAFHSPVDMYTPRSFRERRTPVLHELMRRHSFATLFSWTDAGPLATHLPFVVDSGRGPNGTLVSHMARANPQWKSFESEREVLVAFLGPHAYISPSWYTSPVTVPTWNYAAVHAYGVPRIVQESVPLREHVLQLTRIHEAYVEPPWDPAHAESLMASLLGAIVGVEIPIARLEASFKFNQNLSQADRAGVISALENAPDQMSREAAALMLALERETRHGQRTTDNVDPGCPFPDSPRKNQER